MFTPFTSFLFLGSTPSLANWHVQLHVSMIFWFGADESGLHNDDVDEINQTLFVLIIMF